MPGSRPGTADEKKKKQGLTNQMLCDEVEKHEGRSLRQCARICDAAQSQRGDCEKRNRDGNRHLEEYLQRYAYTMLPPMTRQDLYEKVDGLELSLHKIRELLDRFSGEPHSDVYYNGCIQALIDGRGDSNAIVLQLNKANHDNANHEYIRSILDFYNLSGHEFLDVPVIMKMLRLSDPHVEHLRNQIDTKYEERRRHLEETEDMTSAERVHNQIDDILENLLNLHAERIELLEGAGQDDGFCANVKAAGLKVKEVHEVAVHELLPWLPIVKRDIDRIMTAMDENKEKRREDQDRSEKQEQALMQAIAENGEEQLAKFDAIRQRYTEILALAEERKRMVDQLQKEKVEQQQRTAAAERQYLECEKHRGVLEDLMNKVGHAPATLDGCPSFVDRTLRAIDDQVADARRDTGDTLLRERRSYYKVFCEFYLVCGELLYSKQRRQEELDSQIEDNEGYKKFVKDSLDPNTKVYQDRIKALTGLLTPCKADIASLRQRMDRATMEASNIEEILVEAGDEIISPVIELQERNVEKQAAVLRARRQVIEAKSTKVESQEEDTERTKGIASIAKKSGGLTSQMRPLSPGDQNGVNVLSPEKRRELADQRRKNYAERLRRSVTAAADVPHSAKQKPLTLSE